MALARALDILSASAQRAKAAIVGLKKRNVLKTCNELPYKVYNSVPVVLYLKPFRTTGCTDRD
jgi:hypothetical protein